MKTVHEFFTNKRMEASRFEYSWFHSWMVSFARVESLRGRISPFEARESTRQACTERSRSVEGLFESLLAEAFRD